jgi:hypothetical protein
MGLQAFYAKARNTTATHTPRKRALALSIQYHPLEELAYVVFSK